MIMRNVYLPAILDTIPSIVQENIVPVIKPNATDGDSLWLASITEVTGIESLGIATLPNGTEATNVMQCYEYYSRICNSDDARKNIGNYNVGTGLNYWWVRSPGTTTYCIKPDGSVGNIYHVLNAWRVVPGFSL